VSPEQSDGAPVEDVPEADGGVPGATRQVEAVVVELDGRGRFGVSGEDAHGVTEFGRPQLQGQIFGTAAEVQVLPADAQTMHCPIVTPEIFIIIGFNIFKRFEDIEYNSKVQRIQIKFHYFILFKPVFGWVLKNC